MGFGCDLLTLSCPNNSSITVNSAYYGLFSRGCTQGNCCPPQPEYDCTTAVSTTFPDDWIYLKYLCDNKTSCQYQFVQPNLPDCGGQSQYMNIFYSCTPEEIETVAFTAYSDVSRDYAQSDTIIFDKVITNVGNSYNSQTSSFTCPRDGLYVFGLQVLSAGNDQPMYVRLQRNNQLVISASADSVPGASHQSHAGASVVIECQAGDVLWTKAAFIGSMYGSVNRYPHFMGFSLNFY